MPELARFFGIIIRMYAELGGRHHSPHFHAYFGEHEAVFRLPDLEMIAGEMPTRQRRLIEAWAELHREELEADWRLLLAGRKPTPIAPLQ